MFGQMRVDALNDAASDARKRRGLRAAGGDPDLFVYHPVEPTLRFFVEVKLENLAKAHPYFDSLNEQQ